MTVLLNLLDNDPRAKMLTGAPRHPEKVNRPRHADAGGRAGIIVRTGIATDSSTSVFFRDPSLLQAAGEERPSASRWGLRRWRAPVSHQNDLAETQQTRSKSNENAAKSINPNR